MSPKREFALLQTSMSCSISFILSDVGVFFRSWILEECIYKCRKRNINSLSRVHVLDETREIRKLQVVVVQLRIRNVQKSEMFLIANLNLLLFCHIRCRPCRRFLSTLVTEKESRVKCCRSGMMWPAIRRFFPRQNSNEKYKKNLAWSQVREDASSLIGHAWRQRIFQTKKCLNEEKIFLNSSLITCRPQHWHFRF